MFERWEGRWEHYDFMHNVEMWWRLGLGQLGGEEDQDGGAFGGGEGGEGGDEMGVGRICQGEVDPWVRDRVIGRFEVNADKLASVLRRGEEREEWGIGEVGTGRAKNVFKCRTDSKDISRGIRQQPGLRHQTQDGFDLGLLTAEFLPRGADPHR